MAAVARVLVVDDSSEIRELVADVLAWAGHETATACDGLDALDVVQRWSPDVIVLDAIMPRMGGEQFARTYRGLPGPHAPIIALTAADDGARRAAEMEAAWFVGKPFSADDLLRLVDRCAGAVLSTA